MRSYKEISEPGTKVGVRVDLNSTYKPSEDSFVNHARHKAHATTIQKLSNKEAKIVILTHHDQTDDVVMEKHAELLTEYTGVNVYYNPVNDLSELWTQTESDVVLYDNLKKIDGLVENNELISYSREHEFVNELTQILDVYINDSFSLSHKRYPSITGIPSEIPGYAGGSLESEYNILCNLMEKTSDRVFLFGGDNVKDSIDSISKILESGSDDKILTMGSIGCIFLEADGYNLGDKTRDKILELGDEKVIDQAYELLTLYGDQIYMPSDLAVGESRKEYALTATPITSEVIDIGSDTLEMYTGIIENSDLVIATGVGTGIECKGFKNIYSTISDQEYSSITGEKTIEFCDNLGLTGFSHTSTHTQPVIDFFVGRQCLPGTEVLLPGN